LSNTNESGNIPILQKILELNKATCTINYIYIYSQNRFSGDENERHLGTEIVYAILPYLWDGPI